MLEVKNREHEMKLACCRGLGLRVQGKGFRV